MSPSESLFAKSFTLSFEGVKGHQLSFVAVRYSRLAEPPSNGSIVLCQHATGTHKEHWRPAAAYLLYDTNIDIGEAWVIDAQHHGESIALNEAVLKEDFEDFGNLYNSSRAVRTLLQSNLAPFPERKVIAVGHSGGSHALILAAGDHLREFKVKLFEMLIFVEPVLLPKELLLPVLTRLKSITEALKWQWGSKEEALQFLKTTRPWNSWCEEIRNIHIEYGTRPSEGGGIELKLPAPQEAAYYFIKLNLDADAQVLTELDLVCRNIPVHVIFGSKSDLIPKPVQSAIIDLVQKLNVSSIRWIEGVGHMAPQQNPKACADAIAMTLKGSKKSMSPPSRL